MISQLGYFRWTVLDTSRSAVRRAVPALWAIRHVQVFALDTAAPFLAFDVQQAPGRQWIIDPGKGTLLAVRDLVATPPHGSRELPPGDDGKPRRLTVGDQPDRFHKPGEVSGDETYEVAEWTDTAPDF
ncbi:hypothetical protein DMB42_45550 [Nonomuraea sp. WAC 01424]|uniref:hypothetical protein n=1 Tax=Nonomuraea sp. WAC 01424 TaxID=2203200 RepID=UPI000F7806DC|nr:hypothetical protein [Nonomuraea sp. WAC 01424]RSM98260.1 hypothetical protein DMB42_45550 [Nonomuraea sp. WAC 01424]